MCFVSVKGPGFDGRLDNNVVFAGLWPACLVNIYVVGLPWL
jgi:hypothetical protein